MPVSKYRTFEDARYSQWFQYQDNKYWDIIEQIFNVAQAVDLINYPRGLFKFKNLKEANEHKNILILA